MSAICIIPARGGSKRIPRKNNKLFHGKPIISYSIATAHQSGLFDNIVVATDDEEIATLALAQGCIAVMRPPELSCDDIGTQDIAAWTLRQLKPFEYACVVYATAPLMRASHLHAGLMMLNKVRPVRRYVYITGWYYWGLANDFMDFPQLEDSLCIDQSIPNWIDINTMEDWTRAEKMYEELRR